jgi:hypothetical protein
MSDAGTGIDVDIIGPGILLLFDIVNDVIRIPIGHSRLDQFPGRIDSFAYYFKHIVSPVWGDPVLRHQGFGQP